VINDIVIREYTIHQLQNKQEGYGFITFESEDAAVLAATQCSSIIIDGIVLSCKLSYRNKSLAVKQQMLMAATGQLNAATLASLPTPPGTSVSALLANSSAGLTSSALDGFPGQFDHQQQLLAAQQQQQLRAMQLPPQPRPSMHQHALPRPPTMSNPQMRNISSSLTPSYVSSQQYQQTLNFGYDPRAIHQANQQALNQNKTSVNNIHNLLAAQQQHQAQQSPRYDSDEAALMASLFADNLSLNPSSNGSINKDNITYLRSDSSDSSQGSGSMTMFSNSSSHMKNHELDILPTLTIPSYHNGVNDASSSWLHSSLSVGVAMQGELVTGNGSPILSSDAHVSLTN
jgi:hypothetical protein